MAECTTGIISSVEVRVPTDECACVDIASVRFNNDGTFTVTLTNGQSLTSPDLRGATGAQGPTGLVGPTGPTGATGSEVEMQYDAGTGYVQWRLTGSATWIDLYAPFNYANEAWKEIKTASTDVFADGTPVPSFALGTGATGTSKVYIRKRYNGDVEMVFQTFFLNATNYLPIVTIPVTPTGYRPTKNCFFHMQVSNGTECFGSVIVDASGLVALNLPAGQTFSGGTGGGASVYASFSFSTI